MERAHFRACDRLCTDVIVLFEGDRIHVADASISHCTIDVHVGDRSSARRRYGPCIQSSTATCRPYHQQQTVGATPSCWCSDTGLFDWIAEGGVHEFLR